MEFIFLNESTLSKFEANFDLRPSSLVTLSLDVFTFKYSDKLIYYQILLVFLAIYLVYYGYEKFYEVWRAEFGSSQRLLINFLDWLCLYLDLMIIYYLRMFTNYSKSDFLVRVFNYIYKSTNSLTTLTIISSIIMIWSGVEVINMVKYRFGLTRSSLTINSFTITFAYSLSSHLLELLNIQLSIDR